MNSDYTTPIVAQLVCDYCDEPIQPGERCVDKFRGVCGLGQKSGQPMVVRDTYDPEEPYHFHEECEELYYEEKVKKRMEDDEELLRFCAGCGCKLTGE